MSYRCRVIHSPLQLLLQLIWLGGNRRFQRLVIPRLALTGGFNRTLSLSFFVSLSVHLRKPGKRKSSSNPSSVLTTHHRRHRYCRYPSTAVAATLLSMQAPSCDGEGRKLLVGFPVTCFQKHKTPAGEKRILSVFARAEIKVKGLCVLRIKGKSGTSKAFLKWMNLDFGVSLRRKKCVFPPLLLLFFSNKQESSFSP